MKSYADLIKVPWDEYFADLSTGIRMCYCVCGPEDGIPVILIHGVTDSRISWSQAAPMMAEKGYRVYVPECRGHGKTDKPDPGQDGYTVPMHRDDILAFMNALGLENAHIVGHSQGSLISQLINIKAPERVLSTTLIETAAKCTGNEFLKSVRDGDGETFDGIFAYDDESSLPESFLDNWLGNTNEDEDFCAATKEHLYELPINVWKWMIKGVSSFDNTKGIRNISGRVLLIWATKDEIFTEKDFEEVKAGLTGCGCTVKVFEGASHCVHWDSRKRCKEVVDTIDDFIKGRQA